MSREAKRISIDDCMEHLNGTTFRMRSPDYGEKYPRWPGSVGLEIEMLPVFTDREPPNLPILHGKGGTAEILKGLADSKGWRVEYTDGMNGLMIARLFPDPNDNITFEPGGQVEFASRPYPCLSDALRRTRQVQSILDEHFAHHGIRLCQLGMNPWHTVGEVGMQMPKSRYLAMNQYYSQLSEYGPRMMRQTCTVQVNLDFGSDAPTLTKRYLAGMLMAPFASAIFSNSPFADGKKSGLKGFRRKVWRFTDPTHTGVPGIREIVESPNRETCLSTYLDYAMKANVVFVADLDYFVPDKPVSFKQWIQDGINGSFPTLEDFKTHLSLMFTEVRPRGFLELRSVDCLPRAFQAVPACFYVGLLYHDPTLERLLDKLTPMVTRIPELLEKAEMGLDDPDVAQGAKEIFQMAIEGFAKLPACFKEDGSGAIMAAYFEHFTGRGRTPADDLLELVNSNDETITMAGLETLEERWSGLY